MTSYDEVTYPSLAFAYTHPDRLATVASLFGMKPAPVEACRVLELGCSDGTNLAAMAVCMPHSEFVGVDSAGTAIARGRELAEKAGLRNLKLSHLDLLEMAPDYGMFDYIIAHGLYTWVPVPVREQILAICRGSLAPQGVAYISFNALPGCHTRIMLREMMLFHNRDFHDPNQRMNQALALLKILANAQEKQSEPYVRFLQEELGRMSERCPESLYHDELSEIFTPLYFHQFMDQAQRHDLQFLGESDLFEMMPRDLTPKAVEVLDRIGHNIILREQYLDFMRGRCFRKTLLCHANVPLNRSLKPDCVKAYRVSTSARPATPAPSPEPGGKDTFQCLSGAKLETADPLGRALFWFLADREPERIPFPDLVRGVEECARKRFEFTPKEGQDATADIAECIWRTYCAGLVDLHLFVPPFALSLSDRPVVSPLARCQAVAGDIVSTLHHRSLKLGNSIQRGLLALLDGSRDRATLLADALKLFSSGTLDFLDEDGKPVSDMNIVGKAIDDQMDIFLQRSVRMAVFMG